MGLESTRTTEISGERQSVVEPSFGLCMTEDKR